MRDAAEPLQCSPGILPRRVPHWNLPDGGTSRTSFACYANGTLGALPCQASDTSLELAKRKRHQKVALRASAQFIGGECGAVLTI